MIKHVYWACFTMLLISKMAHGMQTGFKAELDSDELSIPINETTTIPGTLRNGTTTPLYLTGVRVNLSDNARGGVYDPVLLQTVLHQLDAGQTWSGPLITVTPQHHGPLVVDGSLIIQGGPMETSSTTLVSVPLHLTINDPQRDIAGSYLPGTLPLCDRLVETCCDPGESLCFRKEDRCIYVAQGFDRQQLCLNQQAGPLFDRIMELQVSADGLHIAYIARAHCKQVDNGDSCTYTIVRDDTEYPPLGVPAHLSLSPDGQHIAYTAHNPCLPYETKNHCKESPYTVLDDHRVSSPPEWYIGLSSQ